PVFFARGSISSLAGIFGALVGLGAFGTFAYWMMTDGADLALQIINLLAMIFGLAAFFVFFWFGVRHDFFTYTAYPVRFNRKNRKIYVFRPPKEGGVQVFSWDEVNFYINRVNNHPHRHLIGHVMEGDYIKFSFVVGMAHVEDEIIKEIWEFIYRYMEEGPKKINPKYILLTIKPSWLSHYRLSFLRFGLPIGAFLIGQIILLPLIGPLIALRWLILKTCKTPTWPDWVKQECNTVENDPYNLPEPAYIMQPLYDDPEHFAEVSQGIKNRRKR